MTFLTLAQMTRSNSNFTPRVDRMLLNVFEVIRETFYMYIFLKNYNI